MSNWKKLEESVRQYAGYIWDRNATSDRIAGVNFDCVLSISDIEKVIIEITENRSLDKIRTDVAKIQSIRVSMMAKNIMIRPYIICSFEPTQGMKDVGKENYIEVISHDSFRKMFFDFPTYHTIRSSKQFGSAIDPTTGENDDTDYIPVGYELKDRSEITAQDISDRIINGEKVILLGDYGTGKSRCFKEVFNILSDRSDETLLYPIAIDLKETWGLENAVEIITRHFSHLGVSDKYTKNVIKAYNGKRLCFLLDGFDEIGSRPWSEDKKTLELLRKYALQGVKDLLSKTGAGCLISGRDHYFNSNTEMHSALGFREDQTTIAKCKNEFSYEEFNNYLSINDISLSLPDWLPKKPLVLKTIVSLSREQIKNLFDSSNGEEVEFWFNFIDAMCERDSKIHAILDSETVKQVLIRLASLTREKPQNVGPITEAEVVSAFHEVTGTYPNEQSTVMLQRLPGLGRVSSETSDRNFVDIFVLDGLRGLDLSIKIQTSDQKVSDVKWLNPLQKLGVSILAYEIKNNNLAGLFISYIKQSIHREKENKISISDALSAIGSADIGNVSFEDLVLYEPHFGYLDFDRSSICDINFVDGIFENLSLGKIDPSGITIRDSMIEKLIGISSSTGMPSWISGCDISSFESVDTLTAIKNSGLTKSQTILVSILIKIYKQPGNGRLEHTLAKGLTHVDKKKLYKIIHYLAQSGFLKKSKDNGVFIYKPVRKIQGRIEKILVELDRSSDEIWDYVSSLSDDD